MEYIYSLPGLFTAIIFHELAHGYTAYKLGDNTAKDAGRLTLNPLKHIDITGFIFMIIFKFGWAKPVPINPFKFKNRKRDMVLVSLAGPLVNFIIALISVFIFTLNINMSATVYRILLLTIWYNIMLGVFNLLPFPPLDGSKILASLLPRKLEFYFYKYEKYLYIVLILLIATKTIDNIMGPMIDLILNLLMKILG